MFWRQCNGYVLSVLRIPKSWLRAGCGLNHHFLKETFFEGKPPKNGGFSPHQTVRFTQDKSSSCFCCEVSREISLKHPGRFMSDNGSSEAVPPLLGTNGSRIACWKKTKPHPMSKGFGYRSTSLVRHDIDQCWKRMTQTRVHHSLEQQINAHAKQLIRRICRTQQK